MKDHKADQDPEIWFVQKLKVQTLIQKYAIFSELIDFVPLPVEYYHFMDMNLLNIMKLCATVHIV